MDRFTIFCTEEQAKKALDLGAPILSDTQEIKFAGINGLPFDVDRVVIPTAEQMIGWLELNARISDIDIYKSGSTYWAFFVTKFCGIIESKKEYFSRKEATLAAIDEALDYLVKIKEEE